LSQTLPEGSPPSKKQELARRQSEVALQAQNFDGDPYHRGEQKRTLVWPLLRRRPDPTLRTYLIGTEPRPGTVKLVRDLVYIQYINDRLWAENDATVIQGLLLAIGTGIPSLPEAPPERRWELQNLLLDPRPAWLIDQLIVARRTAGIWQLLPQTQCRQSIAAGPAPFLLGVAEAVIGDKHLLHSAPPLRQVRRLAPALLRAYRTHPDPGVHAGVEWLLRCADLDQAGRGVLFALAGQPPGERFWHVSGNEQTFIMASPTDGDVEIGSPADEEGRACNEPHQRATIAHPFALGMKLVTVAEFSRFRKGYLPQKATSPGEDTPANSVSWFDAAAYCRWLSEQENIPADQMCYPPVENILRAAEQKKILDLPANFLERTGYRLPTEVEWEYACRSGSVTPWFIGLDEEMLGGYAWFAGNSKNVMHPVGTVKPNVLGLFDMHGNAWQWCHACFDPETGKTQVDPRSACILRGGSFRDPASSCRSACRFWLDPWDRYDHVGFRVARTHR
jgi:formylglycine-generating enzyme required for sulfatase activity